MKVTHESAMVALPMEELDMKKVEQLAQHRNLIKALDSWILSPDRDLIPLLHQLAAIVKKTYHYSGELELFRGFDVGGFQDSMGLDTLPNLGQIVHFKTDERALSFSTQIGIARSFGGVIVTTKIDPKRTEFLDITHELSYLVQKERNITDYMTQHEVIILPPSDLKVKVVQAKRSWSIW